MKRNYVLMSILLFTFMFLTGCGKIIDQFTNKETDSTDGDTEEVTEESEEPTDLGDYNIQFSGDVIEDGDQFMIEGNSNLLPGSRVVGEVIVDEGETVFSDTSELVDEDGSFYMELEHHQYGEAEINIRFDFENAQEDEIKRHYGEKGQKLEGPFIYKHEAYDGILNKAEVKIDYDPNGTNDLTLQALDWYDLPEDYGDPRVWIEVEEITEDGEFFYIHGRSNILEGSEIKVDYKYNRGKTQINPDGSFDFKIDYEYVEDEDIVITFEPSSFQWNEIEEAYGATGQKLVGNLVVSDKFNTDKQFIEKRIPWDNKDAQSSNESGSDNDSSERDDEPDSDDELEEEPSEKEQEDQEEDQAEDEE